MADNIFTKIIDKEIPASIVYEDDEFLAFLDIMPFEKGHTLVIPKEGVETIMDMGEEHYLRMQKVVLKIAKHYRKTLGCSVNIWSNNGGAAEQLVPHVHFHIIPRFNCDKKYDKLEDRESYLGNEMELYRKRLKL